MEKDITTENLETTENNLNVDEKLKIGIGTTEPVKKTLGAAKVVISEIKIEAVGAEGKKNDKVVCIVKHPEKSEPISISAVKLEKNEKLVQVGLWYNTDEEGKLQNGSSVADTLKYYRKANLIEFVGTEVETVVGDNGFLAIKAY